MKTITEAVTAVIGSALQSTTTATPSPAPKPSVVTEGLVVLSQKPVMNKSEVQSGTTKDNHEKLYKGYVDSYNKVNSALNSVPRADADNPNNSEYRRLKIDEVHNFNGVKLHELWFSNSGDIASQIRADSIPFMRLNRDWGTFDQWQLDFRACGMAATEGWAVLWYDPYSDRYFNSFIEKHTCHVPVMAVPVLVVDTWHHAWFFDYPGNKLEYMNRTMREINWNVVEMRMVAAEMCKLNQVYQIRPVVSGSPEMGTVDLAPAMPPIPQGTPQP